MLVLLVAAAEILAVKVATLTQLTCLVLSKSLLLVLAIVEVAFLQTNMPFSNLRFLDIYGDNSVNQVVLCFMMHRYLRTYKHEQ
jgi:hypothetical protein